MLDLAYMNGVSLSQCFAKNPNAMVNEQEKKQAARSPKTNDQSPGALKPENPFEFKNLTPIISVSPLSPFVWLKKAAADMLKRPIPSLGYGVIFWLMGNGLQEVFNHAVEYSLTLAVVFLLMGPFLATGLYNISRQIEQGKPVSFRKTMMSWQYNISAIAIYVLLLTVLVLIFGRASLITFALFFSSGLPTIKDFIQQVVSMQHLDFLISYGAVVLFFSFIVFTISAVSIPMMMDRQAESMSACFTSIRVMMRNPVTMILWGLLILFIVTAAFLSHYVTLIVCGPLLGHATWHAYRATVGYP